MYENGFGNVDSGGSYWLGLKYQQLLTEKYLYSLEVDLRDCQNDKAVSYYQNYKVRFE